MDNDFCSIKVQPDDDPDAIQRLLASRRIAIVGLSDDPSRPSADIARYLLAAGKQIVPINPNHLTLMGLRCYASLEAVPGHIDLVNVFRRPEFCADIARSAVAVGASGLWLQIGVVSPEARALARQAGMDFVENRCIKVEMMLRRARS